MRRLIKLLNTEWTRDLAGAWVFYTIFPALPLPNPRFLRIARFAPIIGLSIGAIQAILWTILTKLNWPNESKALLCIGFGIWITGGLHIDGLMDTADGLAAGEEKCQEAMKDSRVGASGVQALILILMIQFAAIIKLNSFVIFAFPIAAFWSRCAPLWAIKHFPYLNHKGASSFHKDNWKGISEIKPAIFALLMIMLLFNIIKSGYYLIPYIVISFLPVLITPQIIGKRIHGHNGDTYGASVVIVETLVLLILALIYPLS